MVRALQRRGRVLPSAGATATIAAATTIAAAAAAATKPDFSDGNLGPDSTDASLGLNGVAQEVPAGAWMA